MTPYPSGIQARAWTAAALPPRGPRVTHTERDGTHYAHVRMPSGWGGAASGPTREVAARGAQEIVGEMGGGHG